MSAQLTQVNKRSFDPSGELLNDSLAKLFAVAGFVLFEDKSKMGIGSVGEDVDELRLVCAHSTLSRLVQCLGICLYVVLIVSNLITGALLNVEEKTVRNRKTYTLIKLDE